MKKSIKALSIIIGIAMVVALFACANVLSADDGAGSFSTTFSYTSGESEHPVASFESTVETKDVVAAYEIINDSYYFFAQKASGASSGYLVYSFTDKYITSFSADMLTVNGFIYTTAVTDYLKVEALVEGETDYVNVPLSTTEYQQLNDNGSYSFYTSTVSNTSALPEKTVKLKVTIDPTYTTYLDYNVRIDSLKIDYEAVPTQIAPPEYDFEDNLDDLTKLSAKCDNLEAFATHAELENNSVVGIPNGGNPGFIQYSLTDKKITEAEITLYVAKNFFNAETHLGIQGKKVNATAWKDISYSIASNEAVPGSDVFSKVVLKIENPKEVIGDLKIIFNNDVGYVMFIDKVAYNEIELTPEEKLPDIPQTGDYTNNALWFAVAVISMATVAAVLVFDRKRTA